MVGPHPRPEKLDKAVVAMCVCMVEIKRLEMSDIAIVHDVCDIGHVDEWIPSHQVLRFGEVYWCCARLLANV